MKRAVAVISLALAALAAQAAEAGKAKGTFVVSRAKHALTHAYAVEKNSLVKVVLASAPLEERELFDAAALQEAVSARNVSAIVVQLDENGFADSTFFFDPKLPAGLEVREVGRFEPSLAGKGSVAGRVRMNDDGYSFGYDATFEAKVVVQPQTVKPLAADATPADHALWRLEQKEVPFDEEHYRRAAMDGDVDTVKLFLTAGMPVDAAGAFRLAVDVGQADVVKVMLDRGADKDSKDEYGQSLVMTAASNHRVDVLAHLIAAGADVSTANQYHVTPLSAAAEQGHLDIVKMLVAAGAKVNARDTAGGTALSVAVLRGYGEIVATLLASGADVKRDREDLLMLAADKPEIKAMLLQAMKASTKK